MRIVYISIIFVLFAVLLLPFLLSFFIKDIPNDTQPSLEGTQIIYKEVTASQYFISKMNNLSGFGMSIKNPYFRNRKNLTLNLYSEDKKLLRTINLNGANIPDGDFIKIQFEPIRDSKDMKYYFQFLAPDTESSESPEVFLTSQKRLWVGDLYINSKKQDSNFSFIIYYKSSNLLTTSSEIFIQWGKRLFADLPFALFYSFLILSLSSYLVWHKLRN